MANETVSVDMIIEAITKGFDTVQKDLKQLNETAKSDAPVKSGMRWTELASKLNVAQSAFQMTTSTIQKTWDILEEGAALSLTRDRFDRLAVSIGTTSDALSGELAVASGGMMSSAEAMKSASDIISLGLADNQKDVVDLASLVSQLGWDMQQVIMTFANQSEKRLDALGLSVTDVKERMEKFEEQGYATEKAFNLAVIDAGQAKLKLLGSEADTASGALKRIQSVMKDLKDSTLEFVAVRSEGAIVGAANVIDSVKQANLELKEAYDAGLITQQQYNKGVTDVTWLLTDLRGELANAREQLEIYHGSVDIADAKLSEFTRISEDVTEATLDNVAAYRLSGGELRAFRGMTEAQNRELEEQEERLKAAREEMDEYHKVFAGRFVSALKSGETAFGQWVTTSTAVGGKTEEQTQQFGELSTEAGRLREQIVSLQGGKASLGLTEDELNEKLTESAEKLSEVEARLGPLTAITTEYTDSQTQWVVNQEAMNESLIDSIIGFEGNAQQIALAAYAMGVYDETQLETALNAAIIQQKIDQLATAFVSGGLSANQLKTEMELIVEGSPYTAAVEAITDGALSDIGKVNAKLDQLANRTVTTRVRIETSGGGVPSGQAGGAAGVATARAFGGPVRAGQLYKVGETGPEYFRPNASGEIIPAGEGNGRSGGGDVIVNNYNQTREAAALAYAHADKIRRERMDAQ